MADVAVVARLQWVIVASGWLVVGVGTVRSRARRLPHRRWLTALEALRHFDTTH